MKLNLINLKTSLSFWLLLKGKIINFTLILLIGAVILGSSNVFSQQKHKKQQFPSIEWVGQISSENTKLKRKLLKKIVDIIIGKPEALFGKPVAVIAESESNLWLLDQSKGNLVRVDNDLGQIPRFMRRKNIHFASLVDLCYKTDKGILLTDSYENTVFYYDFKNEKIRSFIDSSSIKTPTGIAYCTKNNQVWITETSRHRLAVFDENGKLIKYVGTRGTGDLEFNFPTDIWIDGLGIIYVIDSMNFRVQILSSEGEFISLFGKNGNSSGFFARPKSIATDSFGHIYVTDALFHNVQVFNNKGQLLYYFGAQGREKGQFWMPGGIYIDKNNYIYVADCYNSRIQIFRLIFHE